MLLDKNYFSGAWQMARTIDNRFEKKFASVTGQVQFISHEDTLICHEAGVLVIDGEVFSATRRFLWFFPAPGRVEVRFDDARAFHEFSLEHPQAHHLCGEDDYDVTYAFAPAGWSSQWDVKGPRKSYRMTTQYSRSA